MEDIIDIIVTETTNLIEITSQPTDEVIDVNIIDNREDITLNVTPSVVEININSLTGNFGVNWGDINGTLSNQTDLQDALDAKADLVDGKVPSSQLPSYVDDVIEVATYSALPATGEVGKIYVVLDTNKIYRWSGSAYIEIADSTAVWGAITGTLSSQTDLQSALNAKDAVLTFSSPLSRSTNTISIPAATSSANGYLTSTDWSIFNGKQAALSGTGFVKASGTTITYDNSTYLTTSSASSIYLPLAGGTITGQIILKEASSSTDFTKGLRFPNDPFGGGSDTSGLRLYADTGVGVEAQVLELYVTNDNAGASIDRINLAAPTNDLVTVNGNKIWNAGNLTPQTQLNGTGFVKASGTTISYDNTSYLPLTGGTLTGTLNGTNITITNSLIAKGGTFNGGASYGGIVTIDGLGSDLLMNRANTSNGSSITLLTNAVEKWNIGLRSAGTTDNFFIYNSNLTANSLTINSSNSAATFASSVTATAHIVSGGTSSQFQKGDGTLDSNTYLTTSSASSTYLAKTGGTLTGALSGTSATFSGDFAAGGNITSNKADSDTTYTGSQIFLSGTYTGIRSGTDHSFNVDTYNGGSVKNAFKIVQSGAATFSSSVTASKLEVGGSLGLSSQFEVYSASYGNLAAFRSVPGDGINSYLLINTSSSGVTLEENGSSYKDLMFKTGGSERMRITSSGNVGIGTTSPTNGKLEIQTSSTSAGLWVQTGGTSGSYTIADFRTGTNLSAFSIKGNGDIYASNGAAFFFGSSAATYLNGGDTVMTFAVNNAERMRITSGGSLLIGQTTATFSSNGWFLDGANGGGHTSFAINNNEAFIFNNRNTGTNYKVDFRTNAVSRGNINVTDSLVSYNVTSDYRLKQDLKPINGLQLVNKIKVYDYEWIADKTRMDGVLAHELAEVLPYAVTGVKDGEQMQSVDYSKIVPVMVQAIKDLKAKIETLENK